MVSFKPTRGSVRLRTIASAGADVWVCAILVAAVALVYGNALGNGFVWDDGAQVVRNVQLHTPLGILDQLIKPVWSGLAAVNTRSNYYRPLQMMLYGVIYQAFGINSVAYHLLNVLLHALATCLVWFVARRLIESRSGAFAAALLFAVHPIHTEAVDWVAAVVDPLCTVLFLAALLAWMRWRILPAAHNRRGWLHVCGVLFFLAMMAKEPGMTLVLVLAVIEVLQPEPLWTSERLRAAMTVLSTSIVGYVAFRWVAMGFHPPIRNPHDLPIRTYMSSALALLADYWSKLLAPVRLNAWHVFSPSSWHSLGAWAGVGVVLATSVLVLRAMSRREWATPAIACAWVTLTLLPVLAIRMVGYNVFAERYLYLPSIGLCLLVGWAVSQVQRRGVLATTAVGMVLWVVVVAGATTTIRRNRDWADDETIARASLKLVSSTYMHNKLADSLFAQHRYSEELSEAWTALDAINREYRVEPLWVAHSYSHIGTAYLALGYQDSAEKFLLRSVEASPTSGALENLAVIAFRSGNYDASLRLLRGAVDLDPTDENAYESMASTLLELKRPGEAAACLEHALEIEPSTSARLRLASVYYASGDYARAHTQIQSVLAAAPGNTGALELQSLVDAAHRR